MVCTLSQRKGRNINFFELAVFFGIINITYSHTPVLYEFSNVSLPHTCTQVFIRCCNW